MLTEYGDRCAKYVGLSRAISRYLWIYRDNPEALQTYIEEFKAESDAFDDFCREYFANLFGDEK